MKKPRLFYYEEGVNAWIPAPDQTENIIIVDNFMKDGEVQNIRFKRIDMTDDELDSLPDA